MSDDPYKKIYKTGGKTRRSSCPGTTARNTMNEEDHCQQNQGVQPVASVYTQQQERVNHQHLQASLSSAPPGSLPMEPRPMENISAQRYQSLNNQQTQQPLPPAPHQSSLPIANISAQPYQGFNNQLLQPSLTTAPLGPSQPVANMYAQQYHGLNNQQLQPSLLSVEARTPQQPAPVYHCVHQSPQQPLPAGPSQAQIKKNANRMSKKIYDLNVEKDKLHKRLTSVEERVANLERRQRRMCHCVSSSDPSPPVRNYCSSAETYRYPSSSEYY